MQTGARQFVPQRLIEAREARHLSATALADIVGVTRQSISNYETGRNTPSYDRLEKIAEKLDLPVHRFFMQKPPEPDRTFFMRSMASSTKSARERACRRYGWLRELVSAIERMVSLPSVNFPDYDLSNKLKQVTDEDIEAIAIKTREYWELTNKPISNIVWLLENNGAIVVRHDLGASTLDAFSEWWDRNDRPYFVLGTGKGSAVRSRFDIAHELGHMVMHRGLASRYIRKTDAFKLIENQADKFASAFLMPEDTFSVDCCMISLDSFRALKSKWKTSIAAMIMRASQIGLIGEHRKRRLFMQYNRRGWRRHEPLDDAIECERPRLLERAINTVLENGVTSVSELETLLAMPRGDIAKLAGLEPGHLEDPEPSIRLRTPAETESGDGTGSEEEPPPTFRFPRGSNSEM